MHQTVIGEEAIKQLAEAGDTPDVIVGCTGGGSNFGGLVFPFLQKLGNAATQKLKERVAGELKTTFASTYSGEGSLVEALQPAAIMSYAKRATGEKYLILPSKGASTP